MEWELLDRNRINYGYKQSTVISCSMEAFQSSGQKALPLFVSSFVQYKHIHTSNKKINKFLPYFSPVRMMARDNLENWRKTNVHTKAQFKKCIYLFYYSLSVFLIEVHSRTALSGWRYCDVSDNFSIVPR